MSEWFRRGCPPPLAVVLLAVAPLVLAGPLRAITRLPLWLTALVWAVAVAVIARRMRPALALPPAERWRSVVRVGVPLFLAAAAVFLLYSHWFGGLVNYAGADGGNHVAMRNRFATVTPGIYNAFVSLYSLWYLVGRLTGTNVFWSLAIVFYLQVALVAMLPCFVAFATLEREPLPARVWIAAVASCAVLFLVAGGIVVWPLEHYHQADGFWAHLFGLLPLVAAWTFDALARPAWLRAIGLVAGVALLRFTYGLNLVDVLVAAGALLLLEARRGPRWAKLGAALLAAGMVAASVVFLRRLIPLFKDYGWILEYDPRLVIMGMAVALAACVVAAGWGGLAAELRYPIAFGAMTTAMFGALLIWQPRQPYYVYKYPLYGVVLLALALVVALTSAIARVLGPPPRRRHAVVLAAVVALSGTAGWLWHRGLAPYRLGFLERAFGRPPFKHNRPLADLGAWKRIEETLARERKAFGGYIVAYGPMSSFMNAAFGVGTGQAFYREGTAIERPGHCVFLDESQPSAWPSWEPGPQIRTRLRLRLAPGRQCVSYNAHWDPRLKRTLCRVCF